jgi:hypothetical protein
MKTFESLRGGNFMNEVSIYIDQRGTFIILMNQVIIPEFILKRFASHI